MRGVIVIRSSVFTSLMKELLSMPQNGLQFLLMTPTTLPVGFRAASSAMLFIWSKSKKREKEMTQLTANMIWHSHSVLKRHICQSI